MRVATAILATMLLNTALAGDFRQADYGMTIEQVKASEQGVEWIDYSADIVGFKTKLAGLDALCGYVFVDDQFVRGTYVITEKHSNKTTYLSDYKTLTGLLQKKYGEPAKDETIWLNDLYKNMPSRHGMAVAVGHLSKYAQWATEDTDITALLTGDNYKITLKLEYKSSDLGAMEAQKKEQETLDAL